MSKLYFKDSDAKKFIEKLLTLTKRYFGTKTPKARVSSSEIEVISKPQSQNFCYNSQDVKPLTRDDFHSFNPIQVKRMVKEENSDSDSIEFGEWELK